ncbi:permease-like cell division protein FtsX, partial [Actinoplanes sp. NPDC026623]|uniref:permease-like cell division protein FtsX n=1 Tax=Actinoplanes sp. NPDC026623 TaxID=3155610 RepID=UPI0033FA8C12
GGAATAVAVAALVAVNVALPSPRPSTTVSLGMAMMAPADRTCTWPVQDRASDVSIFLAPDSTAAQRADLQAALGADPLVRDLRFESREAAYARFKALWADSPDFVASVSVDSLPAAFRVKLVEPSGYVEFAARFLDLPGVEQVVGAACPGPTR